MLLKLTIENFLSFRDKTVFSMAATSGRRFNGRVQWHNGLKKRMLPISAIFGGENSGYDSFAKALRFIKELVTESPNFVTSLNLYTFQNYTDSRVIPVKMGVDIIVGDNVYRFNFMAMKDVIVSERLIHIEKKAKTLLYERRKKKIKFPPRTESAEELKALFKTMPKNQLFLQHSVRHKFPNFKEAFDWFRYGLQVTGPGTQVHPSRVPDSSLLDSDFLPDFINLLDQNSTQTRLDSLIVPKEAPIHAAIARGDFSPHGDFLLHHNVKGDFLELYYRYKTFNDVKILKLFPTDRDCLWEKFPISRPFSSDREKQGLVAFLSVYDLIHAKTPRVYVSNYFDNAFELIRARGLLAQYLEGCDKDRRSQFILTLSNALLLDKKLFRQDEIWIAEHGDFGNTRVLSMGDYKKSVKGREAWRDPRNNRIGGIYTPLIMAALEVGYERK
jgi:AAA15 family ATPase/GTPase